MRLLFYLLRINICAIQTITSHLNLFIILICYILMLKITLKNFTLEIICLDSILRSISQTAPIWFIFTPKAYDRENFCQKRTMKKQNASLIVFISSGLCLLFFKRGWKTFHTIKFTFSFFNLFITLLLFCTFWARQFKRDTTAENQQFYNNVTDKCTSFSKFYGWW